MQANWQTCVSSGSSAAGGSSNLPAMKCSIPVQAIMTPMQMQQHSKTGYCSGKRIKNQVVKTSTIYFNILKKEIE